MPLKLPRIIGHRGAAGYAPENTLAAIHAAADLGIEWVELDVKLTKDCIPIIFHDDTLERTTNTSGNVADMTFSDIRELDCGSWYGESFIGTKIPSLEEAIDTLIDRNLGFNMEIKPCPGREKETAEAALDILSTIWDDHDRLLISSFQHVSLETALDMATDWHRGLILPKEWPENWQELAQYLQVSTININGNTTTREQVEDIFEINKLCLAYTINDAHKARHLQAWGIDGFFSDTPDIIKDGIFSVH
ncbi:MAG: glycerophosphodiester phosphodiesterase family protein [Alphaproteobacteria bacterium]